ncbi:hypothetical protein VMCG_08850 [Cytospora schulzeri]|uniref:SEC7 domain-containing protein n=1 Tax=Cytospora schulzeri TaxID=448051 RepID=A0A423VUQ1_9PEZI|nr:hypothetical protein VMCG_08850 [Valsa malicola]
MRLRLYDQLDPFEPRSSSAVSPSSRRREKPPATIRTAKLSAYSYYPDQDRDAPQIRRERDRPDRDRDRDRDRERDRDRDPDHDNESRVKDRVVETFLDTLSPVDMSNNDNAFSNDYERDRDPPSSPPQPHTRDSHDLSLSPRNVTRDSLLGNMLLSLDQFSMGQMNDSQTGISGFGPSYHYDDDDDAPASRTITSTSRGPAAGQGRGHGYSHSSDYEDSSSTMSRGRRSGSGSTGFQSNLGRINSMREMSTHRNMSGAPASRPLHSRGGKGSKSSSTNSFDGAAAGYAQVLGSQRWAHGLGRKRSSSFELATRQPYGVQAEQQQHHQQQQQQGSPWHVEFSNGFFSDDYDAAPTPTIPVGPRRLPNMPSMPSFPRPEPMGEPLSPVRSVNLERKRSSKSSRSTNTNRQAQSSRFSPREETPPMPLPIPIAMPVSIPTPTPVPTVDLDPAPAPNVGYEKAKDKEPVHASVQNPVSQPKEKPGFFKRMFGGGSKTPAPAAAAPPDQSPANVTPISTSFSPSAAVAATNSPNQLSSQAKSGGSNPSSRPGSQNHSSHGLQKKPSSFFRRRKKSVPDTDPPPLPPPVLAPAQLPPVPNQRLEVMTPRPQPSPVTSLRKAMDPYLIISSGSASALATPLHHPDDFSDIEDDDPPAVRGFSPDYEPDPKATIRSVPSESRPRGGTSPAGGIPRISTPTGRRGSRTPYDYERTNSFLHDETDSEDSPRRVRKRASLSAIDTRSRSANRTSLAPLQTSRPVSPHSSNTTIRDKKLDRLTQDSMSTDNDRPNSLQLPIEGALTTDPKLKTRVSMASIPSVKIEDSEGNSKPSESNSKPNTPGPDQPFDEPDFIIGDPTEYDRTKAQQIFDGKEDFIPKDKAASWMGEEGVIRQRVLRVYMDLYDFTSKNIVTCLREVCNRLVLRAETQQVDRILVAFSNRWCDCNPNHGFKSIDVIHTICYSIMLLNTDLHMADIEHKMTRSQFIKNTMTTIRQALADSAPDLFDRPSILPGKGGNLEEGRKSGEHERSSFRNSFVKLPMRAASALGDAPTELEDCGPLVKSPFDGPLKAWESQMEIVLKDTYSSIKDERLPLFGAEQPSGDHHGNLSVMGMLKRSPSVLSKAPSEGTTMRGRVADSMRASNSRWSSKSRSRPRGFGSGGLSSSRTSFDDGQSMWSPVESAATWSRGSLGRTQASLSMDSFGSHFSRGEGYQQSMGFANALSQAIIREDPMGSVTSLVSDDGKPKQLLEDESLELAGPPWVKEGMVVHKHHLDGVDKKSKDRNWSDVFAVIQKGTMNIFSFSPSKSTGRRGHKAQNHKKGAVVGGGNWQDNATNLGSWNLRLTLASALPPPGYSKQRPHVWALSLPTGAVHLFQVGTPEICKEFVTTANYWSARLSTHPLVGGISNMEYGWSENVVNNALVKAMSQTSTGTEEKGTATGTANTGTATSRQRSGSAVGRTSLHSRGSSFRSVGSFDFGNSPRTGSRGDPSSKLPGDRVTIADWTPPTQSMRASNAPESQQLQTLLNYVKSIEDELQQHNVLRSPMLLAFNPRGANMQKAMANWERKSSYLLREIVKFRTYVDCLQHAESRKKEIWREREVARKAARGSLIFDGDDDYDVGQHLGGQHDWDEEEDEDDDGSDLGRRESTFEIEEETVLEEPEGDMTLKPR